MDQYIPVACEVCGQLSELVKNSYADPSGKRIEWQKATVKPDGIYFTILCPNCGEREQCMAKQGNTE